MPTHSHHVEDVEWASVVESLRRAHDLQAPLDAQIAGWLVGGRERQIADLGCGAGGMTVALASAVSAASAASAASGHAAAADDGGRVRVLAVDGEPALLAETRRRISDSEGLGALGGSGAPVIEVQRADLAESIPLATGAVDLIWASAVVHHLPDQQATLDALAERLAPGGRLALAEGGLRVRCLPWDLGVGEPGLEIRLDLAQDRWFAAMRRGLPGTVAMPYGWPGALRRAGLVEVTARSFLHDLPAPLSDAAAETVAERWRPFLDWDGLRALLDADDVQTLRRLSDPTDPLAVLAREEMFLLSAQTVHVGRRADR